MFNVTDYFQDFYQMLVHHITTLALLSFGYTINMLSVSVLIALVHDVSDVPLEVQAVIPCMCVCPSCCTPSPSAG